MPTDRFLRLAAALAASFLGGCSSGPTAVEIDDVAFVPSGRASLSLSRSETAPSIAQNGHAIEASWTGARGSDKQQLETGDDDIIFGGQTFVPPADLRNEYNYKYGEIVYRWRKFFGRSQKFGMEALGGVGHGIFVVTTTVPATGQTASMKFNTTGLALGVGGIWKFRPETSLQVRLTAFGGEDEGISGARRFDVHVVHSLARNVALRGGLTSWGVTVHRFQSDVRASFGGPAAALEVAF